MAARSNEGSELAQARNSVERHKSGPKSFVGWPEINQQHTIKWLCCGCCCCCCCRRFFQILPAGFDALAKKKFAPSVAGSLIFDCAQTKSRRLSRGLLNSILAN